MRFVAENTTFPVSALPDNLNEKEKLVLARRLVKDGLLRVKEAE
jgi:hypothetical protein